MTDLKDILHFYIGCKMMYSSHHEPQDELYELTPAKLTEAIAFGDRPILRKTDDLNYAELLAFAQADNYYNFTSWDEAVQTAKNIIKTNEFRPQSFQWLLSCHIDLFGLIDSDQAIDQKTVTP